MIIIFGGTTNTISANIAPGDSLHVLNLNNFEWSTPKISGNIPTPRMYHKANVIGKYMIVTFGKYDFFKQIHLIIILIKKYNEFLIGTGYNPSTESDVLLLDISNNEEYVWTDYFDPS